MAHLQGDRLVLPWDSRPDAAASAAGLNAPPFANAIRLGEHDELVTRWFDAAVTSYRRALARARTASQTAFAQLLVARALAKESRHDEVRALYRTLLTRPANTVDEHAIPFPSIQILPASGGEPRTLVTLEEPDISSWRQMARSADGKRILFTKHHQEVWQIAAIGGMPERLTGGLTMINSISVHPDGHRIAVSAGNAKYETWVMTQLFPAEGNAAGRCNRSRR